MMWKHISRIRLNRARPVGTEASPLCPDATESGRPGGLLVCVSVWMLRRATDTVTLSLHYTLEPFTGLMLQ